MVLLVLVCIYLSSNFDHSIISQRQVSASSPTWEVISFLNVGVGSDQIHYGVFGFTGSTPAIGYQFE